MAYSIRGTRGLARFVADLHLTIPAYPRRSATASGQFCAFLEGRSSDGSAPEGAARGTEMGRQDSTPCGFLVRSLPEANKSPLT